MFGCCFQLDPPCSPLGRIVSWGPGLLSPLSCSPGLGEVGGLGPWQEGQADAVAALGGKEVCGPGSFGAQLRACPGWRLSRGDSAPALPEDPGGPAVATPALLPPPGTPPGLSGFLHLPGGSGRALSPVWSCSQGWASGQRSPTCAQLQRAAGKGLRSPVAPSHPGPGPLLRSDVSCPRRPWDSQLPSGRTPEYTPVSPPHLHPRAQRPVEPRGLCPSTPAQGSRPSEPHLPLSTAVPTHSGQNVLISLEWTPVSQSSRT